MRNVVQALGVAVVSFTATACMLEPYDGFYVDGTGDRILFFGLAPLPNQGVTLEALFVPSSRPDVRLWTRIAEPTGAPFDTWSSSTPIRPCEDGPLLYPWLWEGIIDHQWSYDDARDRFHADVRATVGNTSTGFFTSEAAALFVPERHTTVLQQARVYARAFSEPV